MGLRLLDYRFIKLKKSSWGHLVREFFTLKLKKRQIFSSNWLSTFYNFLQTVWWQSTDATLLIMTSFKRKRFGDSQGSIVSILMGIMMPSSFSPPSLLLDFFFIHVFNQITDWSTRLLLLLPTYKVRDNLNAGMEVKNRERSISRG